MGTRAEALIVAAKTDIASALQAVLRSTAQLGFVHDTGN